MVSTRSAQGTLHQYLVQGRATKRKAEDDMASSKKPKFYHGTFITLKVSPGFLRNLGVKKPKKKVVRPRRAVPYSNSYRFEFGEDRLPAHKSPSLEEIATVGDILEQERIATKTAMQDASAPTNPFHAGGGISIDSIVRVIIAQACTNESALDAQQTMIQAYPYVLDGQVVVGKKPNYHAMRQQSLEKLQMVLKKAGLFIIKAKGIKECLDAVFAKNLALLPPGEVAYNGNDPTERDFVPGLLSLDYLYSVYDKGGKQAVFDNLVELPLIGVKSACCLMGFNMALPIFAVDTHVAGMAKLLG